MDTLAGKQIALTGRLAALTHAEAAALIRAHGGQFATSVSRQTSVLVVGQESWPLQADGQLTEQLQRAIDLKRDGHTIDILAEAEFLEQLALPIDGIHRRYTLSQLMNLLDVPRGRIRAWMRADLIRPIEEHHGIAYFDFRQVAGAKTLCDLTKAGISTDRMRASLEQLRTWLGDQPLEQLALLERNGQLLVRLEDGLVDPSGQMYFEFNEDSAVVQAQPISAAQWFESGCWYEQEGNLEEAIDAYRQALLVGGPSADVCFNLANVLRELGQAKEASERYRQVIEMEPNHADAWNNLGVTLGELSQTEEAMVALKRAIALGYLDAHFNLADLLDGLGRTLEAHVHWRAYLRHDPQSLWARHARRKLG